MPIFERLTPEAVLERILSRMETDLQTREGSFAYDMAAPIAFEIWRTLMTLDELVDAFYVNANSGKYLDAHAALFGLERREGTCSAAEIQLFGADGTVIPAGTAFFTGDGLEFQLTGEAVIRDGAAQGTLRAAQAGGRYDVPAGEISRILRTVPGLERFACGAAQGGADPEDDAALFARLEQRRRRPAASGNRDHYREWALSVDGVGAVRVTPLWNGPGTVRVLLAGYDRRPVSQAVADACAAYIEQRRPVGAQVTVASARAEQVDVYARTELSAGASPDGAAQAFTGLLDEYLAQAAFESHTVRISRVGALLLSVDGVTDYSGLTLNGAAENLTLDGDCVPVTGTVTLA